MDLHIARVSWEMKVTQGLTGHQDQREVAALKGYTEVQAQRDLRYTDIAVR